MKLIFKLTLVLVFSVLVWSSFQISKLTTEYSVDQFYPSKHDLLINHDRIKHQFRLNEESPYLFVVKLKGTETWLNRKNIKKLEDFSAQTLLREDVSKLLSITQIEGASSDSEEMVIGNIFNRLPEEKWKEATLNNPLLYPLLITKDFRVTLIAIESKLKSQIDLENFEKTLKQEIQKKFPGASVASAGVPSMQTRLSNIIRSELGLFLFYSCLIFCFIFYVLFSHWSAIVCALLTLISSNVFAVALLSAFSIPMNAILVTLPVIVSVSIMSLLIHSLHLWANQKIDDKGIPERIPLVFRTLKEIFLPNSLGILTTSLGFLAIAPSSIPIISQYGLVVAFVLTLVSLLGQATMFLLLPWVTPKMRPWFNRPALWALWSVKHSRLILLLVLPLSLLGGGLLTQLNFSMKLFDDLPASDNLRTTTEWIDQKFGGILSYEIQMTSKDEGFWKKPEALLRLSNLSQRLRDDTNIGSIVTVSDFFQGKIPQGKGQVAETFFLFSMAEKNPLLSFLSEDGKTLRLAMRLNDLASNDLQDIKDIIKKKIHLAFPEVTIIEGGMANYAHSINQEVAKELILNFWQPLLVIGLFLIFIFKSFKWAILSCLPNFIPPAFLIGALAMSQVQIKPAIALIFSIALGFAFNNTLYILTRLRSIASTHERRPLEKALMAEANPCLFESIVMFSGFSIFLISDFTMNQNFGGFMLISILAGFIADLFFLPAFLKVFPKLYAVREQPVTIKTYHNLAASLILAFMTFFSTQVFAQDAKEILKKSQALLDAKDDQAMVEMKIVEQNGEAKSRKLKMKTLRKEGFSVLARIESPADIKDMAFLGNVDQEGNEKQWVYLPSSGQVRRLVTGKTKAGLLGSEISPEDLNSEAIKSSSVKMQKVDAKYYWIELIPSAGTSEYSKVVTKIAKDDLLPKFTAYFIKEKLKKTVAFKDYKKIGNVFRAHIMNVQNHLNGRSTEVRLSSIKVNTGLRPQDFSQSVLKD